MATTNPAKKRKAAGDPPEPPLLGRDDGTVLSANISLADLDRLIDQRVADAVDEKTLALSTLVDLVDGLQREIEGLALRCESLERSVQVLKKEGNWTYSARDLPRSYWIERGHDEDYAEGAEDLIQSIKEGTEDLRSDGGDEVYVSCDTFILHDNALNPHWEQLSNAIQLSECINELNLGNVSLNVRSLQMIEASVQQKGIATVRLADNQFYGGEGVQFAINVLKNNNSIEKFGWHNNSVRSTEDACDLVDAVLEHPTIRKLALTRSLNEGIAPYTPVKRLFGGIGNGALISVNLSFNNIKTNGDRCIPDYLSTNPPLERLYLGENQLTDADALDIGLALQSNTNLRVLDLEDNALTKAGKTTTYISSVLGLNRSDRRLKRVSEANLNTVSGANHTCEIVGIVGSNYFMNRNNESAKWNRRRKLCWLLRQRHFDGRIISQLESEFSEDGMGIVPQVLACINMYFADSSRYCLEVLFELVRDWKIPEILQLGATEPSAEP